MIHIAFITDENYILPTRVAIRSIIKNASESTSGTIHIIGDFPECFQSEFTGLETEKFHIDVILMTDEKRFEYKKKQHLYVTSAALYKFLLPEVLPKLDKVLYLDGDVLVTNDLSELFVTNIDGLYLAAVEDMCAVKQENILEKTGGKHYFNSGVMLLNLSLLRSEKMAEKLIEERMRDDDIHFMDQTVLNRLLGRKVKYLSIKFNFMKVNLKNFSEYEIAAYYHISLDEYFIIHDNPVVRHFTNVEKPWNSHHAEDFEVWSEYLEKDEIPLVFQNCLKTMEHQFDMKLEACRVSCRIEMKRQIQRERKQENEIFSYLTGIIKTEIKEMQNSLVNKLGQEIKESTILSDRKYVIYGAGDNARQIFHECILSGRAQEIFAFTVTDSRDNPPYLYGIPVIAIQELVNRKKELIVIVSVDVSYRSDVLAKLDELGFENVVESGLDYEWNRIGES